eukprot:987014-Rhodomonas_salina.1
MEDTSEREREKGRQAGRKRDRHGPTESLRQRSRHRREISATDTDTQTHRQSGDAECGMGRRDGGHGCAGRPSQRLGLGLAKSVSPDATTRFGDHHVTAAMESVI